MHEEDIPGFPPLASTRHSRSSLLDALGNQVDLPSAEVAVATFYVHEIEDDIVALLERACVSDIDEASGRLLFRGLHILGGRRRPAGFKALVAYLRGPQARVDDMLGGAVTETLPKILAGMFDGDTAALVALMTDRNVEDFVRSAAIGAFSFLVFDGRIEKQFALEFLQRFDVERMAPPGDFAWHAWMTAVASLGFDMLSERALAAFADGRIPDDLAHPSDFRTLLAEALARPDDIERFAAENLGYIEDVLAALEAFWIGDDGDTDEAGGEWLPPIDRPPARNPFRDVGRNDPCPCGSGKRFKTCCLA